MNRPHVDISVAPSPHSAGHRAARVAWGLVWLFLFRTSPRPFHRWRALLLRLFGARVSMRARVYPRCRVWAPWNLTMGDFATLGEDVDCYCVAPVTLGAHAVVSQYCYLCAATHDFDLPKRPLVALPITIGPQCWLAADVFVGPGVTIGEGTVVGARSSVFETLPEWQICYGNPARPARARVLKEAGPQA